MKYIINGSFNQWIKKTQLYSLMFSIFFVLITIFTSLCMYLGSEGRWDSNLKGGMFFNGFLLLLLVYGKIKVKNNLNKIIRVIKLNESDLEITLQVDVFFGMFTIRKKHIKINYKSTKFSLNEFPVKKTDKSPGLECYFVVSGGEVYYLIHEFFENSLVDTLSEKLNVKL